MKKWQQYTVLAFGLFTAGGFALQGIASYSGHVDAGGQGGGQMGEFEMPSENFRDGGYNLSAQQQLYLAVNNDIVFVNVFYDSEEDRQMLEEELRGLPDSFGQRVYVSLQSSDSDSDMLYTYGFTEFPQALVIGGNQERAPEPVSEVTSEAVSEEICNEFRQLGDQAGQCL